MSCGWISSTFMEVYPRGSRHGRFTRSTHLCTNWSAAARLFYLLGWEGGTRTEGRIHAGVEARIYGRSQVPGTESWLATHVHVKAITCFKRGASLSLSLSHHFAPLLILFSYFQFKVSADIKSRSYSKEMEAREFSIWYLLRDLTMNRDLEIFPSARIY